MAGVRNPNTDPWTPQRTERLIALKRDGLSASQIAKALGGTTKCAVVGKFQVLGLTRRGVPSREVRRDPMAHSANQGVKTKALRVDVSDPQRLALRRFSWEADPA